MNKARSGAIVNGIDASVCQPDARPAIEAFITLFGTQSPSLEQIWAAMDFVWDQCGVDNRDPDPRNLAEFYSHPIWLLNGLFVEQHAESLKNRQVFTDWVASLAPSRVADFGGGYGTLGRMIAAQCPDCLIEVADPFPRPEALSISRDYHNLTFPTALNGEYDVIIATDVFEHVTDPVGVAFEVASHIAEGGYFLTANHFAPSIKCHLPMTFHFNQSWDHVMRKLGFERQCQVGYGTVYRRVVIVSDIGGARRIEWLSRILDRTPNIKGVRRLKRLSMSLWRKWA